ncbi:hypothetical protein AURDEDRAFT_161012 [Auricularia subglabra TFB-10046 SS5]|nr:hypothetical protein AURDEDRAFT_161012 [Auricularia subglabra TFB-10046 SS5]
MSDMRDIAGPFSHTALTQFHNTFFILGLYCLPRDPPRTISGGHLVLTFHLHERSLARRSDWYFEASECPLRSRASMNDKRHIPVEFSQQLALASEATPASSPRDPPCAMPGAYSASTVDDVYSDTASHCAAWGEVRPLHFSLRLQPRRRRDGRDAPPSTNYLLQLPIRVTHFPASLELRSDQLFVEVDELLALPSPTLGEKCPVPCDFFQAVALGFQATTSHTSFTCTPLIRP